MKKSSDLAKKSMTKKAYLAQMKSKRAGPFPKPSLVMTSRAQKRQSRSAQKANLRLKGE